MMNFLSEFLSGEIIHSIEISYDSFTINLEKCKIFIYTRLGLETRDTTKCIMLSNENVCFANEIIKERHIVDIPEFDDDEPLKLILDDMSAIIIYPISNADNTPERAVFHQMDPDAPKCIVVD